MNVIIDIYIISRVITTCVLKQNIQYNIYDIYYWRTSAYPGGSIRATSVFSVYLTSANSIGAQNILRHSINMMLNLKKTKQLICAALRMGRCRDLRTLNRLIQWHSTLPPLSLWCAPTTCHHLRTWLPFADF